MVSEDDLWRWMRVVSGAVTSADVSFAVAEVGAHAADASFANLALLDTEACLPWVRVVHGSFLDSSIAARWIEFPLSAQTPLCEAMQTGLPVLLGSPEIIGERYPNLLADTLAASLSATASLPLYGASGSILGAAGFAWAHPQEFGAEQMRRLDLIAGLAAQALDRALLYERDRAPGASSPTSTEAADRLTMHRLTRRDLAVLRLLAVGYTHTEIANLLGVSVRTVESTRARLRESLGLRSRAQLVAYANETGLANPNP